ncbi:MAG: hypothetical protein A3F73_07120 [Gallionellales bacterium RIFCSPLOWO2_12_FULL_59_22]|nr:MAG: hypothetical protein A3H99_01275 [Gallionellales bacterium RIFCSPLOWO2_02_FULL_59_110]OGT03704.1 MAG: hypothetical protein A2Z65_12365 [Gallionellales bacterium RIFCSPLOWO2_02_58_13]OGT10525.1 MAG: hypothetical protein A3F73_07120 [Gallionellales bacterium RIFCSPLOWO2_12_FULL_59_22]
MIEIIPNFHPALVHFPIALTAAALAFTAIGTLFRRWPYAAQCLVTGRWMLWGAALFALIAAAFGWFASNSVAHDEVSHAAMVLHRNWALGTLTALLALAAWDVWRGRSGRMPSPGFLGLLVVAWLLVNSTAWHGAELVYRHGLGVMSLPKSEGLGHIHEHGAGHGDMPVQGANTPHEDGYAHDRNGNADGEHPHDAEQSSKAPAADGAGTAPKKASHTHAPGTPPHKD